MLLEASRRRANDSRALNLEPLLIFFLINTGSEKFSNNYPIEKSPARKGSQSIGRG